VAAADAPEINGTDRFRKLVDGISLPFSHFRDMPFTDPADIEMVESRMRLAGLKP
jgi:hypothetical protein